MIRAIILIIKLPIIALTFKNIELIEQERYVFLGLQESWKKKLYKLVEVIKNG